MVQWAACSPQQVHGGCGFPPRDTGDGGLGHTAGGPVRQGVGVRSSEARDAAFVLAADADSGGGGVAILLHPQSRLRGLTPLWEDECSSHFMALSGRVGDSSITVACIYAPVHKKTRERLFRRLRSGNRQGIWSFLVVTLTVYWTTNEIAADAAVGTPTHRSFVTSSRPGG